MKVIPKPLHCLAFTMLISITSCTKKEALVAKNIEQDLHIKRLAENGNQTLAVGDTILNVTYQSGTTNSGITGIKATDATATDAAYVVTDDANNYAIAHKIVYGDPGYYSSSAYRSESDAGKLQTHASFPDRSAVMSLACC